MTDDASKLPEVLEAFWDRERIESLFADLAVGADVKHVQVRMAGDMNRPGDESMTLEYARQLFGERRTSAIQIDYDFDGQSWCDTLIGTGSVIRIIRTRVIRNASLDASQ